ncbi:hypothetical protein [Streptomyces xiamenensis]|uniref:hypothetical protein n=1 Tax=Streptomyces xiamenensis TaxID=408015 RepID=UPI0035E320EC
MSTNTIPDAGDVFAFGESEIRRAAGELWPAATVELGAHVPSVTGYVRRLRVDGRPLYAKHSVLGISLVSLLLGAAGGWDQVRAAQREYVARPDALLTREAGQLRVLAEMGRPRVCAVAGHHRGAGVLFTVPAPGPSLATLLLAEPHRAQDLLEATYRELERLHRPSALRFLDPAGVIVERGIEATFRRKFNGLSGGTYLANLGAQRCTPRVRGEVVPGMRAVVARLLRPRVAVPPVGGGVLVYGDLKPEHVFFAGGAGRPPVLIDPGLMRGLSPVGDLAKLISRTVLLLTARAPGPRVVRQVESALGAFAQVRMEVVPPGLRAAALGELVSLWLMDTINIMTTYLSAPAALPLPAQGEALVLRASAVVGMLHRLAGQLATSWDSPAAVVREALSGAVPVLAPRAS